MTFKSDLFNENMKTLQDLSEYTTQPEREFKYCEDVIVTDFLVYLNQTYGEHYKSEDNKVECFDIWLALDNSATPTFRNTAIKYLWRYGKKGGCSKNDLFKAMHYTLMCLYSDFYRVKGKT